MVKTNIQTFTGEVEVLEEFYVGSNLVANDVATHVLTVNNPANDAKIKSDFFVGDGGLLSNIATTLQAITDQGNASSNVLIFNSNTDVTGYKNVGFVTTSNVGIQNTAPTHTLSIGDKVFFSNNTNEALGESVMVVEGRINATRFQGDGGLLSNIATTLESIADQGNASSNVLIFNSNVDIPGYKGVGFVTTSNVGIQNTNPGFNTLSVGSNLFVNIYGSNVLTVHGNAAVSNLLLSEFTVSPAHGLQDVTLTGRHSTETVQLTNTTTGLEVTSNINVAGEVIITDATRGLDVTSNIELGGRLKFDTNVFVDTLRVADMAANIVTYDRTTGELLDSSGTFMNKFAVVSEQPPSDLFANTTTVTNHGGYTLTTSNLATNSNTYNAFDGTANAWVSGGLAGGYIGGSNVFLDTNLTQLSNLHPTRFGDWLAIEFPYKTTLRHMKLTPLTAAQFPARANVYATNDNHTWSEVKYWGSATDTSLDLNPVTDSNVQTIVVDATEQFKKYALVATKAAGNSSNVAIQDWQLFTESFSIDGGKVAMAQQAATGGETVMDQHGPHSRLPNTVPLKKYPEIDFMKGKFDSRPTTNTFVQGGYTFSPSSSLNPIGWPGDEIFDGASPLTGGSGWLSNNSYAGAALGSAPTLPNATPAAPKGEYITVKMPKKIKLSHMLVSPLQGTYTGNAPIAGKIYGGLDGTNWTEIGVFSGFNYATNEFNRINATSSEYYSHFALVGTAITDLTNPNWMGIGEWELYGYEEDPPVGDTSVDTTFTSIMNTPQTTGANVYVDGNLGGNANTNRVVGPAAANTAATYDETGKYWTLNGQLTSNITIEANTFLSGDQPHAVSVWFNSSNLESNTSNSCIFSLNSGEEKIDNISTGIKDNYVSVQILEPTVRIASVELGFSIDVTPDGTRMVVGAPFDDTGAGTNYGSAYIYTYSNGFWDKGVRLLPGEPSSGTGDQGFGAGVAINSTGTRVAIGAQYDDTNGYDQGAVYIYEYSNGLWSQTQKMYAPTAHRATERYGYDLSMSNDGTRLIVGTRDGGGSSRDGKVYVYTYSSGSFQDSTVKVIQASDVATAGNGAAFGYSVSMSGDGTKFVAGAEGHDTGGTNIGAAYVFTYNSASDTWSEQEKIQASDKQAEDKFGYCVSMSNDGTTIVATAPYEDTSGNSGSDAGAVYIYKYANGSWFGSGGANETKLQASDNDGSALYGWSAALNSDGTKLIVGARYEDSGGVNRGAAYVHEYDGSSWFQKKKLRAFMRADYDHYGKEVAITGDGEQIMVSAPYNSQGNTSDTGAVFVYQRDTTNHLPTNLKIQSNTWHNLTYTYQGQGGSRVTYLDGKKVSEEQAEDTFGPYPPFRLRGYNMGGYAVSSSSVHNDTRTADHAFDDVGSASATGTYWQSVANTYETTGDYNWVNSNTLATSKTSFIDTAGGKHTGEWIKLEMPHRIKVSYLYYISTYASFMARDFVILGSNDDAKWDLLKTVTNGPSTEDVFHSININADSFYKYYVILTTRLHGSGGEVLFTEISFYGHRENDIIRLPEPNQVLKYPRRPMNGGHTAGDNKYINRFEEVSTTSEYSTLGGTYSLVKAFDNIDDQSVVYWSASKRNSPSGNLGRYAAGSHGAYNGETPTGKSFIPSNATAAQKGEWIKMKSQRKLKLTTIELLALSTTHKLVPSGVLIWGSDDDSNWNLLKTHVPSGTGGAVTYSNRLGVITVNSTVAYKYHAMVMTHMNDSDSTYTLMSISQMRFYGTEENLSIPIQIGGGNIDKVANFRVYDKFIDEDQALEIWDAQKDEFGRAKSSMTLQKGRLGLGTTEPEGRLAVLDEPDPDTYGVQEFPPKPLTGYKTHIEGHGEFCVTGSGPYYHATVYQPWMAFGKVFIEDGEGTYLGSVNQQSYNSGIRYTSGSGVYAGTNRLGEFTGEWIQLELPYKIKLSKFHLSIRAIWYVNAPRDFHVLAYDEDTNQWVKLGAYIDELWTTSSGKPFSLEGECAAQGTNEQVKIKYVNSTSYYKKFALISSRTISANNLNIANWRLFGYREQVLKQSTLHDGQLTLTKNLTVPRIGPDSKIDNTPRRDRLLMEFNTTNSPFFQGILKDTSGRGNDAQLRGNARYDELDQAIILDGSGDYIRLTPWEHGKHFIHTFSAWVRLKNPEESWTVLYAMGNTSSSSRTNMTIWAYTNNSYWRSECDGGGGHIDHTFDYSRWMDKWMHVAVVRDGEAIDKTYMYIDGVRIPQSGGSGATGTLAIPNSPQNFVIGTTSPSPGSEIKADFSNIKIYDCALTTEDIKILYNMGRCDEGHHLVNFSKTRVGIGLGDGEAPRGALDVRGDIYGGMPVFFDVRFTSAPTATEAGNRIVWDTVNHSRGGGFNRSTGVFTAPIAGIYKFSYWARGNIVNQGFKMKPRINGSPSFNTTSDGTNQNLRGSAFMGGDGIAGGAWTIVPLEAGGTFDLIVSSHGGSHNNSLATFYNGFTGEYISSL